MEKILVSAPGKVILFGEHSVVYGRRAVAMSVDLRCRLDLIVNTNTVSLTLPNVDINVCWTLQRIGDLLKELKSKGCYLKHDKLKPVEISKDASDIIRHFLGIPTNETKTKSLALLSFFHLYFSILKQPLPTHIHVDSEMPTGAGLGSSAAYAVCLAASLLKLSKVTEIDNHKQIISGWAFNSEKILHGTPSGIDNSICVYGKGISFKNKIVTQIKVPAIEILLVNTKVARDTKSLVKGVKELHTRYPDIVDCILNSIDQIAEKALDVLKNKQENCIVNTNDISSQLNELIDMNHCQLNTLGVSHPKLERIINIAKEYNLHAKLTGAGGGGFAYVYISKNINNDVINKCKTHLEAEGFQVWKTQLGTRGLDVK